MLPKKKLDNEVMQIPPINVNEHLIKFNKDALLFSGDKANDETNADDYKKKQLQVQELEDAYRNSTQKLGELNLDVRRIEAEKMTFIYGIAQQKKEIDIKKMNA